MAINKQTVLDRIDALLSVNLGGATSDQCTQLITRVSAAIESLAPPGSQYINQMQRAFTFKPIREMDQFGKNQHIMGDLMGVLRALREDYLAGHLQSFHDLIHADLFSDFLDMAQYFFDEGYKDPAAVMAGGVLEEHLRKLCGK